VGFHQSADQKVNKMDVLDSLQFQGLHLHKQQFTEALSAATLTVDAEDNGKVFLVDTTSVITLPSTGAAYGPFVFVNNGADGTVQISIDPAAADKIFGCDMAGVDNKDLINTLATAKKGDYVKIVYGGATGWSIAELRGIWAAEA
jgi:hypothetical protein